MEQAALVLGTSLIASTRTFLPAIPVHAAAMKKVLLRVAMVSLAGTCSTVAGKEDKGTTVRTSVDARVEGSP